MTSTTLTGRQKVLCLGGCVAFFIVAYFAHGLVERSQSDSQFEEAIQGIDGGAADWRFAELEAARAPIPDNENSAFDIERAARYLPQDGYGWSARRLISGHGRNPDALDPFEELEVYAELVLRVEALEEALPLAEKPRGRFPLILNEQLWFTLLPHLQHVGQVAQLLTLDALYRGNRGDREGAARSCRAALNALRSLGDEPFLMSQIKRKSLAVVVARGVQHLLNHGVSDPETLADLQRRLEAEIDHPSYLVAVRSQRALVHAMLESVEAGKLSWSQLFPEESSGLLNWYATPSLEETRRQHTAVLSYLGRIIEAAEEPMPRRTELMHDLVGDLDGGSFPRLAGLVRDVPALERQIAAHDAQLRCTATAVAAERYRSVHGHWPKTLADLAPAFIPETPLDPADGEPLGYDRAPDGVIIWSRCPDDRGRVHPIGDPVGRMGVAVLLWDVEQRGRPKQFGALAESIRR